MSKERTFGEIAREVDRREKAFLDGEHGEAGVGLNFKEMCWPEILAALGAARKLRMTLSVMSDRPASRIHGFNEYVLAEENLDAKAREVADG